ncbi:MAG TPA: PKD domain-containing protein, partial [Gemmatimonadales bacterium]|nr:PKD domain-containing protein [Gemmatimonadales bacterium]
PPPPPPPPNETPVVNAGGDQTILLGVSYTLNASFSDPDNGPWNWTVDWGDGTSSSGAKSSPGSISPSHTYSGTALLGSHLITVTVTDSVGASGSDSKTLHVVLSLP